MGEIFKLFIKQSNETFDDNMTNIINKYNEKYIDDTYEEQSVSLENDTSFDNCNYKQFDNIVFLSYLYDPQLLDNDFTNIKEKKYI